MNGFLDFNGMLSFLGGRSKAWGRLHVHEIPHFKLYDRLLFDPAELRAWVVVRAERCVPLDTPDATDQVIEHTRRAARQLRRAKVKQQ